MRVLMLIHAFGNVDGLTKIAKLDFLLRYPTLLERLARLLGKASMTDVGPSESELIAVESRMVRYKYGPWDDRYYPIIGMLVGMGLIRPTEGRGSASVEITPAGRLLSSQVGVSDEWVIVQHRCQYLKENFDLSGNALKEQIYRYLPEAVDRPWRVTI